MQDPKKVTKNRHLGTITQFCRAISSQPRHVSTIGKNLLSSNNSSTCPHNMVNFGTLAAEIGSLVCDTPANFNGFHVLAALLHGTPVVGISQTLWRWPEGATCIRQGDHHVGHLPTFLVHIIHTCTKNHKWIKLSPLNGQERRQLRPPTSDAFRTFISTRIYEKPLAKNCLATTD